MEDLNNHEELKHLPEKCHSEISFVREALKHDAKSVAVWKSESVGIEDLQSEGDKYRFVCYEPGEIQQNRLLSLLTMLDKHYIPPISSQTELRAYADKVSQYAAVVVLQENEYDVGVCAIYTNNPPYAYITSLGMLPSSQGQGLGGELMQKAKEIALKNGCAYIKLTVHKENTSAYKLYKKEGFKTCNADESSIKRKEHFLCMECKIS
jgi:ribosomal protein S18 acetylase RimI-like enzyme